MRHSDKIEFVQYENGSILKEIICSQFFSRWEHSFPLKSPFHKKHNVQESKQEVTKVFSLVKMVENLSSVSMPFNTYATRLPNVT